MPEVNANLAQAASEAAINRLIASISRSATKLNEAIHNAAVLCIEHASNFGDCTSSARLVDAMPKSHRRSLLIEWFRLYSPISIAKNPKSDKMKAHLRGKADANKDDEGFRKWDLEGAKATPFYAIEAANKEPDVPTLVTISENIHRFIARTQKQAEKIANDDDKAEALKRLDALKKAVA